MRRLGLATSIRWLTQIVDDVVLTNPSPAHDLAAVYRLGQDPVQPIALAGAVLGVLSEDFGLPVWTLDHHFDLINFNFRR